MQSVVMIPTQSAAGSITSAGFQLADLQDFSVTVDFTGSNVVGTLTLEGSNSQKGDGGWITVSGSSQAVTASADHMWVVATAMYRWVRVVWAYTSGTGNITATLVAKQNVVRAG